MWRVKFYAIALIVLSLGMLSACSPTKADKSASNLLRVDIGMEPPTLDPALAEDAYSYRVVNDLFAGLLDVDQANRPILGMAESYSVSPDGKTYTFMLRHNLKFSDGSPITSSDFAYSWRRLVDPKTGSPYNFLLKDIVNAKDIIAGKVKPEALGVNTPDPYTLVVQLAYPSNSFLVYITVPNVFVVSRKAIDKFGSNWTQPNNMVTSGAYVLNEHVPNGHILVTKNPNYYVESEVRIKQVMFFPYTDTNTALSSYETHALDTTWQTVPVDKYQELKARYPNELHTVQWERTEYLDFNMQLPKYANNPKLRQALTMAIDREVLTEQVLKSGQKPLYSIVTPTIENGSYKDLHYDWADLPMDKKIAEAQKLYKEAGYSNSHPLKITLKYRNNDLYKKMSLAIASMWRTHLGVDVEIQNEEWKALVDDLHKGDYDIAQGGWGADYNSVTTYSPLYECGNGNNNAHYCNPNYDSLIRQAESTSDAKAQTVLYKKALKLVLDDYPTIPLFEPSHQRLINPRVNGYNMEQNYLDNVQSKWMSISK